MVWPFRAIHDDHDNGSSNSADAAQTKAHQSDAYERARRISVAAYYRAAQRGFAPGHENEDWIEAEKEIDGPATAPSSVESIDHPA